MLSDAKCTGEVTDSDLPRSYAPVACDMSEARALARRLYSDGVPQRRIRVSVAGRTYWPGKITARTVALWEVK